MVFLSGLALAGKRYRFESKHADDDVIWLAGNLIIPNAFILLMESATSSYLITKFWANHRDFGNVELSFRNDGKAVMLISVVRGLLFTFMRAVSV